MVRAVLQEDYFVSWVKDEIGEGVERKPVNKLGGEPL